jgi:hypothetical protein
MKISLACFWLRGNRLSQDTKLQASIETSKITKQPARTKDRRLDEMESNGRESYVRVVTDFRYRHGDINILTLSHRQGGWCTHFLHHSA